MSYEVITPGIPERDGCQALTRIGAFILDEGVVGTLQYQFRNRDGVVLDLTPPDGSEHAVVLRIREAIGLPSGCEPTREVPAAIVTPSSGTVTASLPAAVYESSGVYVLSWALQRDGANVAIRPGVLSVERTLFGSTVNDQNHLHGPPTIGQLRLQIVDSAIDNLLLQEVEFSDDEILQALLKPLHEFNSTPPPLPYAYNSRNFPWVNEWLDASIGYLYQFAAAHYRRNRAATSGGGMTLDDKNREPEYLRASGLMLEGWRRWFTHKKYQLNGQFAFGCH